MNPEDTKLVMAAMSKEMANLQRIKTRLEIEIDELKKKIKELMGRSIQTTEEK